MTDDDDPGPVFDDRLELIHLLWRLAETLEDQGQADVVADAAAALEEDSAVVTEDHPAARRRAARGHATPPIPIPLATLLAVTERMLTDLRFPSWVDPGRVTQLTLTRAAVTADWVDADGGRHHVTIAVGL